MEKIPMARPSITEKEIAYVDDAMRTGWGERCYDYIKKFEHKFKAFLGCSYAVSTSSCTGAINIALATIGLHAEDEVIFSEISWITAASPVAYFNAKPVFVDILEDTWCIDPSKIESAITPKTKAIFVTHVYGNVCEMDKIMSIAKKHKLPVIEDCAEALGSEYKGKKVGTIGDIGVFSFHGAKTCITGEGGMISTNNEIYFKKAAKLNNGGRETDGSNMFYADIIGYKYKMSNFQAALGLAQLERAEELIERKRQIFYEYKEKLHSVERIKMNPEADYIKNSFWLPTVIFDRVWEINRDDLINYFKKENIDIRPFFYPVSSFPMFTSQKENGVAYGIYERGINLPSYHDMTSHEIDRVVTLLKRYLKEKLREKSLNKHE